MYLSNEKLENHIYPVGGALNRQIVSPAEGLDFSLKRGVLEDTKLHLDVRLHYWSSVE